MLTRLLASLLLSLSLLAPAQAEVAIPPLTAHINDTAGLLNASQREALEQRLIGLELRKGAQLVVLTLPSTGDDTIEGFAVRAFEQWQVGRKNIDDGVLLVLASEDRALRIEVGYGLEGAITDALASRIIREQMIPLLREGQFAAAIEAGVLQLERLIDGESLPEPVTPNTSDEAPNSWVWIAALLVGALKYKRFYQRIFACVGASALVYVVTLVMGFDNFTALGNAAIAFMAAFISSFLGLFNGGGGAGPRRGGGGFGGGGFGGGGGRSGGGGASGRW